MSAEAVLYVPEGIIGKNLATGKYDAEVSPIEAMLRKGELKQLALYLVRLGMLSPEDALKLKETDKVQQPILKVGEKLYTVDVDDEDNEQSLN